MRRLYRAALWRVRNRLLLTTFLFGVVTILLIAFLLSQAVQMRLGQYASAIVRDALDSQIADTGTTAGLLVIELVSVTWSIRLTRSITRSVHDLYEATQQVAAGNLAHRAAVRGFEQLAELSGSFNTMTGRVQQLIAEVKEKEDRSGA